MPTLAKKHVNRVHLKRNYISKIIILHCVKSFRIGSCSGPYFPHIRTEYGEIQSISSYSLQMRENADQNNSEHRHIFCSATIFINYTFYNCFPTLFQTSPLFQVSFFNHKRGCHGRSHPDMFLGNGVLKICSKFTGEHPCRSATSIRLQSNFIEIILRHG